MRTVDGQRGRGMLGGYEQVADDEVIGNVPDD